MQVDRRWYWLGAALAAAGFALVAGMPLGTVLYVAALLACPAAMLFGMGMMGRTSASDGGGMVSRPGFPQVGRADMAMPAAPAGPSDPAPLEGLTPHHLENPHPDEDPLAILKIRLAKGEILLEEYDRLVAAIIHPDPLTRVG